MASAGVEPVKAERYTVGQYEKSETVEL